MPTINNVREFVINALRQYHTLQVEADNTTINTMLNNYYTKTAADEKFAYSSYVTSSYEYLKGVIIENEEVTATALLDLNTNKFGYAYYDSTNHHISFSYASNSPELTYVDCANFIIDGMVNNVSIEDYDSTDSQTLGTSYLFIDFNTVSGDGHTDIKIPLQSIFNPGNYYTKSEADTKFAYASYVTSSYEFLKNIISEDEEATAIALLDINNRINNLGNTLVFDDKEDIVNKKTDLSIAANISDTYYPSTSAVSSYVTTTYNSLYSYVTDSYTYLVDKIIENEEVTVTSILDLNTNKVSYGYIGDLSALTSSELNLIFT